MQMNQVPVVFHRKLFILLFIGFIFATAAGVLSHESGHYFMARYYGFGDVHMRYNSTSWQCTHNPCSGASDRQHMIITAAGPVQTILTGTIGFLLLLVFKKNYKRETLALWQWIIVFLALFWLREISNLLREFYLVHFTANHSFSGDEFFLSASFGFSPWFLNTVLGAIALFVLGMVIFVFVPARQRFTFILSGLFGGIAGAVLWLGIVGPRLMP